jgi:hypothetical protein
VRCFGASCTSYVLGAADRTPIQSRDEGPQFSRTPMRRVALRHNSLPVGVLPRQASPMRSSFLV